MKDGVLQVKDLASIGFYFKFVETLFFNNEGDIISHCGHDGNYISRNIEDLKTHILKIHRNDDVLEYFVVSIEEYTLQVSPTVTSRDVDKKYKLEKLKHLKCEKESLEKRIKGYEEELSKI